MKPKKYLIEKDGAMTVLTVESKEDAKKEWARRNKTPVDKVQGLKITCISDSKLSAKERKGVQEEPKEVMEGGGI